MLLNEIGEHFLKMPEYDYGRVPSEKRAELANRVVGYLYSILKNELSSINPNGLFERVCFDLEIVMYRVMISQMRYAYDISCYPEKANMIFSEYNEANKSSVALKFLAEYIAAVPPVGQKSLGEMQYNRLLAICHLIIEWAYKNDSFVYNIVNTPIDFLKSGRIGMPKDNDEYLANINASARIRHLNSLSNPNFSSYSPTRLFNDYEQELDEAFIDEYGFSFQQFIKCILTIGIYGESMTGEVKKSSRQALIEAVHNDSGIDKQIIGKIVNQITLSQRTDFLVPPSPFEKYDVYPWRFNRELSFTRRPIMKYKNELIWGNRQLHHMWRYAIDLLMEGKYKARNKKLKQLLGKISDKRGNDFNTAVYTKLASYEEFIVKERVAKINGKKISDFNGNVLGDIDILCIIPKRHKIIVGEVKDFSFAKNPYEMQMEYKKIFIDDKKPCYITKHKRRVSWIKDHIDDVLLQFNLKKGKWSVEMALFVSEEIVSNQFFHKNENVIVYSDITEALIESI